MTKLQRAIRATKIVLFIVLTGLIGYDIGVIARGTDTASLSYQLTTISNHFILIPFAWGFLGFHFFGSKLGKKLFHKIPTIRYFIWISIAVFMLVLCIVNLFNAIPFIEFLEQHLYLPLLMGQVLGLFWYQDKKG